MIGPFLIALLSSTAVLPPPTTYDFSGGLPAGWTYARSDTNSTVHDNTGTLQKALTNTPRIDHDINGNLIGYMNEPAITNRLTDHNANPTTTSGWTASDTTAGVFVIDNDPAAYLSASTCKLQVVCNTGKLFHVKDSSGTTAGTITSVATITTTTKSTFSAWMVVLSGTVTLTRSGGGTPETLIVSPDTKLSRKALIVTPSASTDQMVFSYTAGSEFYFILGQMEPAYADIDGLGNVVPTSEIITSGGASARVAEITAFANPPANGSIVAVMQFAGYGLTATPFAFATVGNSNADYQGPRLGIATVGVGNGFFSSVSEKNTSSGNGVAPWSCPPTMTRYPIGFSYKPAETTMCAGPSRPQITPLTNQPVAPSFLYLGCRSSSGSDAIKAWYMTVTVFSYYATPAQMGAYMFNSGDSGIAMGGQSNGQYYSLDQAPAIYNNAGEVSFVNTMNTYWPTTRNWLVQGATGGTALLKVNDTGSGWWYDPATGTFGPAYQSFKQAVQAFLAGGGIITNGLWDQGENDAQYVSAAGTSGGAVIFQAALVIVLTQISADIGGKQVGIIPIGRRQVTATPSNGYDIIRGIEYAVQAANPSFIFMVPEKYGQQLDPISGNAVHMSPAGYAAQAIIAVRKSASIDGKTVSGAVDGPVVSTVSRSGTTVSGTLSSACTGTQGALFFDGTTPITFSSFTVSGTAFSGTLASTPSGTHVETFYPIYNDESFGGSFYVSNYTAVIKDTSANTLPACGGNAYILPYSGAPTQMTWGDATQTTSGNGTLTTWSA